MEVAAANAYRRIAQANQSEQLILDHLPYVRHVLGRTVSDLPPGVDLENLEAAGILGLVEAARQFDHTRGVAFTTYSYTRIRGAILDELRRNCPLSRQMLEHWEAIRSAYHTLPAPVGPESLAAATGLTVDEVTECLQAIRLTNPDAWHDELNSLRADDDKSVPERALELREELQVLADLIEQLPVQERTVLTLYHMEDLRLKEIGEVLRLSESRISRVLTAAELRLKETLKRRFDRGGQERLERRMHTHGRHSADRSGSAGEPHSASRQSSSFDTTTTDRRLHF